MQASGGFRLVLRGTSAPLVLLSSADWDRFQRWGFNAVLFVVWWGQIEPNEKAPRVYDEATLSLIGSLAAEAHNRGIKPFLSIRVSYGTSGWEPYQGWPALKGADYVNHNLVDAAWWDGGERYKCMLQTIAERFPDLGICVWHFPYHSEIPDDADIQEYYSVTLPRLYNGIRVVGNNAIILNPIWQGRYGDWNTGLNTGQYDLIDQREYYAGQAWLSDPNCYFGFNNHDGKTQYTVSQGGAWNGDVDQIDREYQPMLDFKAKYGLSSDKFVTVESLAFARSSTSPYSIEQSRLDWVKAHLEKMKTEGLGWFYWWYRQGRSGDCLLWSDGSDTPIATLHSLEEPPPECDPGYHWDETTQTCVKDEPPPYHSTYIAYASGVSQADIAVLRVFGHRCLPNELIGFYDWCGPSLARLLKGQSLKNTVRKVVEWLVCQLRKNLTL